MTPMASSEIERKYDVTDATPLPLLQALPAIERVSDPVEFELEAVYWDTADFALAARRITLRRRTGGADAGWHLKLPVSADERLELAEPLGTAPGDIPEAILQEVRACVRGRPLVPIARLHTHRAVRRLLGADETILAVFCDDQVHASRLVPAPASLDWREWEIELVAGDASILDAVEPMLADAGARPSGYASKLARALGDQFPTLWPTSFPVPRRKALAIDVLLSYVHAQMRLLTLQDPLVRHEQPDAVHQMRVACRRLRSVLATYRPLLDGDEANQLRTELRWLARALGSARDLQVIQERLTQRLSTEPPELIVGPIALRITEQLETDSRAAQIAGLAALDSARYIRLLDALDAFLAAPPVTETAGTSARRTIPRLIKKEWKKLRTLVRVAQAAPPGSHARDLALHEVRKRAKRLRCAAEAAIPVHRKAARRLAVAAQEVQTILGEHKDSVVARELLLGLASAARLRGESGFSYGRLHALEQSSAAASEAEFKRAWRRFAQPALKR